MSLAKGLIILPSLILLTFSTASAATVQQEPSPLLWPASQGRVELVRVLLDQGVDPDAASDLGETPLMAAVVEGHLEIVRLLLDRGADPNKPDNDGDTPLGNYAAAGGSLEIVELLLERGADVNSPNIIGATPLLFATVFGREDLARVLLDHNADVDAKTREDWTPWMEATAAGNEAVARLLEDAGAEHRESLRAAAAMTGEGLGLALQGNIPQALAAFSTAEALDPGFTIPARALSLLCWSGSLSGYAESVISACDRAVAAAPDDGDVKDSRGLARALTSDSQGAIDDFEAFLSWPHSSLVGNRQSPGDELSVRPHCPSASAAAAAFDWT